MYNVYRLMNISNIFQNMELTLAVERILKIAVSVVSFLQKFMLNMFMYFDSVILTTVKISISRSIFLANKYHIVLVVILYSVT